MANKSKKYEKARSMYESGLSIQDVADFFGISRQGMHDILRRRGTEFRSNLRYEKQNHFWRGTSASDKSQNLIEKAIMRGDVVPKENCEECGKSYRFKDGRRAIQAHHCDYNKPLDVIWLCQKCHHVWHQENKAIEWRQ